MSQEENERTPVATRLTATIGPESRSVEVLKQMLLAGMKVCGRAENPAAAKSNPHPNAKMGRVTLKQSTASPCADRALRFHMGRHGAWPSRNLEPSPCQLHAPFSRHTVGVRMRLACTQLKHQHSLIAALITCQRVTAPQQLSHHEQRPKAARMHPPTSTRAINICQGLRIRSNAMSCVAELPPGVLQESARGNEGDQHPVCSDDQSRWP